MTSERHIVQVSAYYPPHLGGQEIAVQGLAAHLADAGASVEVVTSDVGARAGVIADGPVRVTRLRSSEIGHTAVIWNLLWWLLANTTCDTVVHIHIGQLFTSEIVWLASRVKKFRYIAHFHADLTRSGPLGAFLPLYKRLLLVRAVRAADAVVVLNDAYRLKVAQQYGYVDRVYVMSNGIDCPPDHAGIGSRTTAQDGAIGLLFVGRLSPHKNLRSLLEAVATTKARVTLDVIGDGECRDELAEVVRSRGLANVKFHGRLRRDEVAEYYTRCDAVVLPSLYEAQPLVLLEAMSRRVPVIASKAVVLDDQTAKIMITVDPAVPGIVDGIEEFAAMSVEDRRSLADEAFGYIRRFCWNSVLETYLRLYSAISNR